MSAKFYFVLLTIAIVQCLGQDDFSENEINTFDASDEISGAEIDALGSFMLENLNVKPAAVDQLIRKFIQLNRDGRDFNDITALRNYMLNIPGVKAGAVDEFLEIYERQHTSEMNERSNSFPFTSFRAEMMNSVDDLDGTFQKCSCCTCDEESRRCNCGAIKDCSECK